MNSTQTIIINKKDNKEISRTYVMNTGSCVVRKSMWKKAHGCYTTEVIWEFYLNNNGNLEHVVLEGDPRFQNFEGWKNYDNAEIKERTIN